MKKSGISIKDIAKMADVSVATVSRVINNNGRFSEQTRQKVMRIIEEQNYHPNELARGLRVNKAQVVGVIVPDITNEFFSSIVRVIEQELLKQDYIAIVCDTDENQKTEEKYIEMLKSLRVGGIIYVSGDQEAKWIENIPAVYVDRQPAILDKKEASTFIGSDNYQGGYIATKRLLDAGRKKVAMVLHDKNIATQKRRLNGYKQALQDAGIEFDDNLVFKVEYADMDHGYKATKDIVESKQGIDGVFYVSDILAIGGVRYFNEEKILIPRDISIIGFDDIPLSSKIAPSLTTVQQSYKEFGKIAADVIVKMINGDEENRKYILATKLIERETV